MILFCDTKVINSTIGKFCIALLEIERIILTAVRRPSPETYAIESEEGTEQNEDLEVLSPC